MFVHRYQCNIQGASILITRPLCYNPDAENSPTVRIIRIAPGFLAPSEHHIPASSAWKSTAMKSTIAIVLAILVLVSPAAASLGGDVTSVRADQAKMQGSLRTTSANAYTLYEIQTATGVAVKEYASPVGKVFAVTWKGPFPS